MLPDRLRKEVMERDGWHCRWCGAGPGDNLDVHHIEYRRGHSYDVEPNLISLCRSCHSFVHGAKPNRRGERIIKGTAQEVLTYLTTNGGIIGISRWRQVRSQRLRDNLCEKHGQVEPELCAACW
jgi:HNH endonuclease